MTVTLCKILGPRSFCFCQDRRVRTGVPSIGAVRSSSLDRALQILLEMHECCTAWRIRSETIQSQFPILIQCCSDTHVRSSAAQAAPVDACSPRAISFYARHYSRSCHGCVLGFSTEMKCYNRMAFILRRCYLARDVWRISSQLALLTKIATSWRQVPQKTLWQTAANSSMQMLIAPRARQSVPRNILACRLACFENSNGEETVLKRRWPMDSILINTIHYQLLLVSTRHYKLVIISHYQKPGR